MPCKDGSLKWVMDSGRKTKTPEGNTIINSIYLDITKDEEARQSELNHERRTKQQYYDLLSSINSNYYFIYLVNLEDGSGIKKAAAAFQGKIDMTVLFLPAQTGQREMFKILALS